VQELCVNFGEIVIRSLIQYVKNSNICNYKYLEMDKELTLKQTSQKPNNDFEISPFVKSLSSGIKIPADYDYKKERAVYLQQKHK
jgi:hypothetical protein